jgi:Zn finger protein HypA/HybF involved in hydrogenase expression
MHELGVTQRLLQVALERAAAAGALKVTALHVEIGDESDVSAEAIDAYWPDVARGTPAEDARLLFRPAADAHAFQIVAIDAD